MKWRFETGSYSRRVIQRELSIRERRVPEAPSNATRHLAVRVAPDGNEKPMPRQQFDGGRDCHTRVEALCRRVHLASESNRDTPCGVYVGTLHPPREQRPGAGGHLGTRASSSGRAQDVATVVALMEDRRQLRPAMGRTQSCSGSRSDAAVVA